MRWGLIARSETDRGLGIQTLSMYENLNPDKTLVVIVKSGFINHTENYPGAETVELKVEHGLGVLDEQVVRDWWGDLDVVITVETFYDWRLVEWAKADGVKTIIHGNPEFYMRTNPAPDVWWKPTLWRAEHLPPGPVVEVPVPERPFTAAPPDDGLLQIMHVAGNAMEDRNGTGTLVNSMRQCPSGISLNIFHQTSVPNSHHMRITTSKAVTDRWDMYKGYHALVMPRRYGGLCLPVLEAMASGLAVFMSDCSPNTMWPIIPLQSDLSKTVRMQTGDVETYEVSMNIVANSLKHHAINRGTLAQAQEKSRQWAETHRWSDLKQNYYDELTNAL